MSLDYNVLIRVGLTLIVAMAVSLLSTPLVKVLAQKMGAMDVPKDNRRMHHVPIPRMGGLAIFLGFLVASLAFLPEIDRAMRSILYGAVVIVILGVLDDRFALKALPKLFVQIAAACIVVFYGNCRIDRLTNPFGATMSSFWDLGAFAYPLTIIWIVAITNAVNFIDGLDGLACGVSCISSVNLLVIALLVADAPVAVVVAAMTGACIGFVPYNFNPAKIFMGDTGSTFLGFMLATISIQGLFKAYTVISFAVPFLLLGLPIFEICFSIIRRLASGKNPMQADRGHFHHRLIDMGFTQKQSVAIAYVLSAILGLVAVLLTVSGAMKALIMLGAVFLVGAIGIKLIFSEPHKQHSGEAETSLAAASSEQDATAEPGTGPEETQSQSPKEDTDAKD